MWLKQHDRAGIWDDAQEKIIHHFLSTDKKVRIPIDLPLDFGTIVYWSSYIIVYYNRTHYSLLKYT